MSIVVVLVVVVAVVGCRRGVREGGVYQSIAFQVPASVCRATALSGDCGDGGWVQMLAAVHFIVGFLGGSSFSFVFYFKKNF